MPVVGNTTFKLGTDPECFVFDNRRRKFVSAHGLVPGTKERPYLLTPVTKVQVDGMALEFNTLPYEFNDMFRDKISRSLDNVKRFLYVRHHGRYSLKIQPTVDFDEEVWLTTPDEAKILGCDPDYNGYTKRLNRVPDGFGIRYRTGAGHIHIGWTQDQEIDEDLIYISGELAKELDATVGVASLLFDNDKQRRKLYGKAGAFRPKPYGMEYRTLSNVWIKSDRLRQYVAARVTKGIKNLMRKDRMADNAAKEIINKNKTDDAKHWLQFHGIPLPPKEYRVD